MSAENVRMPLGVLFIEYVSFSNLGALNGVAWVPCESNDAVMVLAKYGSVEQVATGTNKAMLVAKAFYSDRIEMWYNGVKSSDDKDYSFPS